MARWPIALVLLTLGGLAGALVTSTSLQGQAPPAAVYPKEMSSYREVVKRVLPAVVSVEGKPKAVARKDRQSQPQRRPKIETVPGLPEEFRKFFEGFDDGVEQPQEMIPRHSFGSGFIIDAKGVILTNNHVVAGADHVKITLKDGREYTSRDIKTDSKNDLAIVRIKADSPLPYIELGDSDAMEIGDRVLAVGAPFGLTGSVTSGIVSAKGRSGLARSNAVYEDYLQTDAAINPGNSGGPLVNLEGQAIGINTAIRTGTGGFQGVGLAITSNLAKNIVDQLVREGKVHRGYIGVQVQPLDHEVAVQLGLKDETGVVVRQVFPKTPAAKAGLKPGDIINTVGGKSIKDGRELQLMVGRLPLKKPVDVAVIRDGKSQVFHVTIEEQPENYGAVTQRESAQGPEGNRDEINLDKVGMDIADLSPELAKRFGYDEDAKGVVVVNVEPDSIAADARLIRGTLITHVNKKPVSSAASAQEMIQKGNLERGILLQLQYPRSAGGGISYGVLKGDTSDK